MITIMFSCECGLKSHKLQVPARETADEDIRIYMDKIAHWINEEHHRVSPNCQATKITDLFIPIEGAEFIGQQVE